MQKKNIRNVIDRQQISGKWRMCGERRNCNYFVSDCKALETRESGNDQAMGTL